MDEKECYFTFNIPPELNQGLGVLAKKRSRETQNKISKAWLMRDALSKYLREAGIETGGQDA